MSQYGFDLVFFFKLHFVFHLLLNLKLDIYLKDRIFNIVTNFKFIFL
jgi:hypothetical protein